jgi:endonuclease/exonuclease/phosphatase family metal-dependent hydrolase
MLKWNAIVLILGIPFLMRVYGFKKVETSSEEKFKVASFNTYALGAAIKTNTQNDIATYLNDNKIDCAVLVEWRFNTGKIPKKLYPYQQRISQTQRQNHGILVVSKYPISQWGLIDFPEPSYNLAGYVDIEKDGKLIRVYGLHLETTRLKAHHYHDLKTLEFDSAYTETAKNVAQRLKMSMVKRAGQVDAIKAHMMATKHPVLLMGDFNDGPLSYTYQQLVEGKNDAFVEAGKGFEATYLKPFPLLRIDYIFYDNQFSCQQYGSTRAIYSDHKLIFAELTL